MLYVGYPVTGTREEPQTLKFQSRPKQRICETRTITAKTPPYHQ
ncbi:hypothetical protein HMPREF0580_0252 [Mobiluncus mulieris ATCC 35239]|uniref:Uncharacterized protein n=1 Tax=Mobiluncus mulieris ATCC 35239 TaxID=871571 RepID=E0QMY8_9ACTO|nr:hypothetical protein HMPREF0577_1889 [Mobiluncus mulieris ATCC 35243]EFM47155.1 hypothetical protein HMPREF0580_0252 [Mobiluncus mulieris ATCC 35239]EFN93569.1 hypothetical protein HMPREF9278_1072 [Mobiluncus mulieris FB024-16]